MGKSYLGLVLVVLMVQAQQAMSLPKETIDEITQALRDKKLTYSVKVHDIVKTNERIDLVARGIGAWAARNSKWRLGNLKLLDSQEGADNNPPEWNVHIIVNGIYTTALLVRSDNLYLCAYWCDIWKRWRELKSTFLAPYSEKMDLGYKYKDLNGQRKNLTKLTLSTLSLRDSVRSLAISTEKFEVRGSLTVMLVMLIESQRFTAIRDCVLNGWETGCRITEKDVDFLTEYSKMSCGVLEGWQHVPGDEYYEGLRKLMKDHNVAEEDVAGMLVVLIEGRDCINAYDKDHLTPINPPHIVAP